MRILEIGTNIAPAYAGMILAEQGHHVTKITVNDPLRQQQYGPQLWEWLNSQKTILEDTPIEDSLYLLEEVDAVVDNLRSVTWERHGICPVYLAYKHQLRWVSMRADDDGRSFDVLAQARAWGDICGPVPFYLGDTAFGLWAAFKLCSMGVGHAVIRHAACLAKLVEGEAVIPRPKQCWPWKQEGTYGFRDGEAYTVYKGERLSEPLRGVEWRLANLVNVRGRFVV